MIRVGLLADIHVRVDELPVLLSWNHNRLMELAVVVSSQELDEVWIIGDLFDRSQPSLGDIISAHSFIKALEVPVRYLEGNHERINKDIYTLGLLADVLNMEALPNRFECEGVDITAISHKDIQSLPNLPKGTLLLSHFRWQHAIFGEGELSKRTENIISKNFVEILLGDVHFPYEPEANVKYISSPYSINFGAQKDYGMMVLAFEEGKYQATRKILDLPCKISSVTSLSLLNGYLEGTDSKHLYRIKVKLRLEEYEKFKNVRRPSNVELIPQIEGETVEEIKVDKLDIGANIKEVLLDTLALKEHDKNYIKEILKEQ